MPFCTRSPKAIPSAPTPRMPMGARRPMGLSPAPGRMSRRPSGRRTAGGLLVGAVAVTAGTASAWPGPAVRGS